MQRTFVLILPLLLSCGGSSGGPPASSGPAPTAGGERRGGPGSDEAEQADDTSPWKGEAAAGIEHEAFAELLREHWEWSMRASPVWATRLGDHRYDDRLADRSWEAVQKRHEQRKRFLERAKGIDGQSLTDFGRTTLAVLVDKLESEIATHVCKMELWNLSAMSNPITDFNYLPQVHEPSSPERGRSLLARYRQIPEAIDQEIANLERGVEADLYANEETTRRVIEMTDQQVQKPIGEWALLEPLDERPEGWPEDEWERFGRELTEVVEQDVRRAFDVYSDVLRKEILPNARSQDETGVGALPLGEACYAARIRRYTGRERSAEELHETGKQEMERINGEMRDLGRELFETKDLGATLEKLRTDESLYFEEPQAIVAKAEAAVAAARQKIPEWFGTLPEAEIVVEPVPDYEAEFTTIAYYRPPNPDGSEPGKYFVNTHEPETRPRFEAEVLAYHEAIPGHHLQIAIAQELEHMPAFRKHTGQTAFVEGWALYTERLADEMGLYSDDLDRMGMLSYDAWRAGRLVVDTGIHAMGWSRERAVSYLMEHTALAENNVRNEVDRYISWPGQALAYKVGQLEILRLREEAEKRLGDDFDIEAFHDAILTAGAVPLPLLSTR